MLEHWWIQGAEELPPEGRNLNCPPPRNPPEKKWKIILEDQGKIFAAAFGGQNSKNTLKLAILAFIF